MLEWLRKKFERVKIHCFISKERNAYRLGFYINTIRNLKIRRTLISLERKWYKKVGNQRKKVIPKDLRLTPTVLLFWYLGDGSLIRRKDSDRVLFNSFCDQLFFKIRNQFAD